MKRIISKEELEIYQNSLYKVTTVTPLVEEPYIEEFTVNKAGLDEFLENYNEYAQFIVFVEMVEME